MSIVAQMTLEEFSELKNTEHDWCNLPVGARYIDKNENGRWILIEVKERKKVENSIADWDYTLIEYPIQIV